jgi:tetrahydrofolate dehydrogenase/cyclohydrolase-like protein
LYGFSSNDNLHARFPPLSLLTNQTFVEGLALKEGLCKLDQYYSSFPEEVKNQGVFRLATYPPPDDSFIVTRLWDKYLPGWRKPQAEPQKLISKQVQAKILEDIIHRHATVTICHSRTRALPKVTRRTDILVAAMGRAKFVTGDMVKEVADVIDVEINRLLNGKLSADMDFESVREKASHITPVPGGVGAMIIGMLLWNTFSSAKNSQKI